MARRHRPPESAHVMRWMISYADFVTLLFAFFVVLYTISSINNKKFDEISEALTGVFDRQPTSFQPIQLEAIFPVTLPNVPQQRSVDDEAPQADDLPTVDTFKEQLNSFFRADEYALMMTDDWIQIEVSADRVFIPGTNVVTGQGGVYLNQLAKILSGFPHAVNVEAFSSPESAQALSDENLWQLSALQAATVTYYLVIEGIEPSRLAAVGYGPYHPIATADDEEGQSLNRRLIFLIDRSANQRKRIKTVTKRHLSAKP